MQHPVGGAQVLLVSIESKSCLQEYFAVSFHYVMVCFNLAKFKMNIMIVDMLMDIKHYEY